MINNEFCSLTLQLIVTLNGISNNITFGLDANLNPTPTITTWVLNGVS